MSKIKFIEASAGSLWVAIAEKSGFANLFSESFPQEGYTMRPLHCGSFVIKLGVSKIVYKAFRMQKVLIVTPSNKCQISWISDAHAKLYLTANK